MNKITLSILGLLMPAISFAADNSTAQQDEFQYGILGLFLAITLIASFILSKKNKDKNDFYNAGKTVSPFNNGLALAGDYLSAASLLAISALVFTNGFDGLVFSIGWLVGWPVLTFLIGYRVKNLCSSTWGDALSYRFQERKMRLFAGVSSLFVVLLYIVAQMVGAGAVMKLFFGIDQEYGVAFVAVMSVLYVSIGGMRSVTFVQAFKAGLLIICMTILSFFVMTKVNWSPDSLFTEASLLHKMKDAILVPGGYIKDPVSAMSIGLALMFGTAGLPHILQRLTTVKNGEDARKSLAQASGWIGYFYFLTFIVGFGAIILLLQSPDKYFIGGVAANGFIGNSNSVVPIFLADAIGGQLFKNIMITATFATIVAVTSGLTLAGASAISHDLWIAVKGKDGDSKLIKIISTLIMGILSVGLGLYMSKADTGFMVTTAFAFAASSIVPVLIMSMLWKDSTTKGCLIGGWLGLLSTTVLVIASPAVWVKVFKFKELFPFASPTLFTMIIAFAGIWVFSLMDNSVQSEVEREKFDDQLILSEFGQDIQ